MPKASWVHQDSFFWHKAAVKSGGQAGAVRLFWTFLSGVFRKAVHPEMDQFTCVTAFYLLFLTHNVGAHLWSATFWDGCFPPKPRLSYRGLLCTVQWTEPVHNREDCSWVLDGVLDIRAQGGTFALRRLSMSIKQRAAFFYHVQKTSQVWRMLDDYVIYAVLFVCECV